MISEPIIVALIVAFPALLAAIAGFWGVIRSGKIHTLVNSNLSRVKADLELANRRIELLTAALVKKA